jgi:uncharacterized membrane protein (DUF373 family)
MELKEEFAEARRRFDLLSFYDKFEYLVVFILTILIASFIAFALWNLVLTIVQSVTSSNFNPDNYQVFQSIFGMMFTIIIALEFKRSILVSTQRMQSVIQVRTVILIGLLAVVRKLIILDVGDAATRELFALAAAIVALGIAYWLVCDRGPFVLGNAGSAKIEGKRPARARSAKA